MFDDDWADEAFQPVDPAVLADLPSLPVELAWLSAADLTEGLEDLCAAPPTAATRQALELLTVAPMTVQQKMLHAAAWDRQQSAVAATAMATKIEATRPSGSEGWTADQDLLDTELALLLRRSDRAMKEELSIGRRAHIALPVLWASWQRGDVTTSHVFALLSVTDLLRIEDAQTIDASVSHRAATMTVAAFRRLARQAVADLDPDPIETREKAKRSSGARWLPGEHGMGVLSLAMPATDGVACLQSLNARADALRYDGDARTHGQRVIDVVRATLLGDNVPGQLNPSGHTPAAPSKLAQPRSSRRGAQIVATIDLKSLLGLQEHPGDLSGHGPVPAQEVRDLLARPDSTLHRLVYDPITGTVVDYTTKGYRPDDTLRDLVRVRDVTCRAPGCTRNAVYCEVEHCDAYDHDHPDQGGETSCENCGLMCRKHHNLKSHRGFRYARPDPATGETRWTTPAGFTYTQKPARYTPTGRDTGNTHRHRRPPPPRDPPF